MTTLPATPMPLATPAGVASPLARRSEAGVGTLIRRRPTVSVLITTHNAGRYLRPALRSVLDQTDEDLEVVVVDDGSTDASARRVAQLAERDARVRPLRLGRNHGISAASNAGLALCRAPRIARMDADDLALPGRFVAQRRFLDRRGAVAVGSYVRYIDARGRAITTIASPLEDRAIQDGLLRGHCTLWHTASMIDAAALREVGGYDERFRCAVDIDLWLRLGEVGRLANQPAVLQQYRYYRGSVSVRRREEQQHFRELAAGEAAARRGLACRFEADQPWRAGYDRRSRHAATLRMGWWAYRSGEFATARAYGFSAVALRPTERAGWALLARGVRPAATDRARGVRGSETVVVAPA